MTSKVLESTFADGSAREGVASEQGLVRIRVREWAYPKWLKHVPCML